MTDYRSMFDNEYIGAWDLEGREATVTIADVSKVRLKSPSGKEDTKIRLSFEGKEKGMVVNKTNARTIAGLYGTKVEQWKGKRITLFATTTQAFGAVHDCIRVRPVAPGGKDK